MSQREVILRYRDTLFIDQALSLARIGKIVIHIPTGIQVRFVNSKPDGIQGRFEMRWGEPWNKTQGDSIDWDGSFPWTEIALPPACFQGCWQVRDQPKKRNEDDE